MTDAQKQEIVAALNGARTVLGSLDHSTDRMRSALDMLYRGKKIGEVINSAISVLGERGEG